ALSNAAVSSNATAGGGGGDGGRGGFLQGTGGDGGDGGVSQGGGLYVGGPTSVRLRNSTIAYNSCDASQGGAGHLAGIRGLNGVGQSGQGGGVRNEGGTVDAVSTIFGYNEVVGPSGEIEFSGDFASASNVLLADNTGSHLAAANGDLARNRVGTAMHPLDPILPPL